MANNDFDDILKSAFGEDEKPAAEAKPAAGEKPAADTAAGTEVGTTAPSAPAASSAAEKKLPFGAHGKGPAKPVLGGGKFARPGTAAGSPPATPAKAAAAAPPPPPAAPGVAAAPPAKAAPAASSSAPAPAALVLTGSAPLPATGQAGGGPSTLLLVLLLAITFISLLISGAALAKISSLRQEMALLNVAMSKVEKSADRSWQIKCGIFSPVPNVRPQEYQIIYEEKDGKLIKKQLIVKPMEEKE